LVTKRFQQLALIATAGILVVVPCTVRAQLITGVAAGPAIAGNSIGYHGTASLRMLIPRWSSELGLEGSFSSRVGSRGRVESLGITFAHSWSRPASAVVPYEVFGSGLYAVQGFQGTWGVSAGLGVRFPIARVQPFAEVRAHAWRQSGWSRMTPVVVGLSF
jgi:hypothetical protein